MRILRALALSLSKTPSRFRLRTISASSPSILTWVNRAILPISLTSACMSWLSPCLPPQAHNLWRYIYMGKKSKRHNISLSIYLSIYLSLSLFSGLFAMFSFFPHLSITPALLLWLGVHYQSGVHLPSHSRCASDRSCGGVAAAF